MRGNREHEPAGSIVISMEKVKEKELLQQYEKQIIEDKLKSKERELVTTALQMEQNLETLKLIKKQMISIKDMDFSLIY